MMNFPGVIAGDPDVLARMVAPHVDGHAPGVMGRALDAYVAAGISTDHEAFTAEEALEKRRRGMWVLIREASNARNLRALLAMVREHGPDYCAFCTDDREPDFLYREGHIDQMCRIAVAEGVAAEDVLVMASLHGARAHGLLDRGAIAPGYVADLALLDDLESFRVSLVLQGRARAGVSRRRRRPSCATRCARCRSSFAHRGRAGARAGDRASSPGQLITGAGAEAPRSRDGHVVADPERDLAKIAVIERHHGTGRVGPRARARLRADARARSPRPSPTTRTTSSSSASTTRTWRCARRARRSSAAGSSSRATARCAASSRCRSRGCSPTRRSRRSPRGSKHLQDLLREQGVEIERAVHDALVPRAVGDPVAEDHRPRAGRRRRVRSSCRWSSTAGSSSTARRSWRASARCTSTRRGWPSAPGGRRLRRRSTSSPRRCATRCTPRRATPSSR